MAKQLSASVLAFEKKLVPSDGRMYGTSWEKRSEIARPLSLSDKTVRGTISNRLKKPNQTDPAKLDAEIEKANIQRIDNCALGGEEDTLKLSFSLKVLSGVQVPSTCNNQDIASNYKAVAEHYIKTEGFEELGLRYASNIASARTLWRNRLGTDKLEVVVRVASGKDHQELVFNGFDTKLAHFDNPTDNVKALAKIIASALSGDVDYVLLEIDIFAKVGTAQDVYPSEELITEKSADKNAKSKVLYSIDGVAAMHSQKIGNALRTIDTWYPDYEEMQRGPIPAEVYGAVTSIAVAFRQPSDKVDFFTLFDKISNGGELSSKNDYHYVMSVLVRGGVFGKKE